MAFLKHLVVAVCFFVLSLAPVAGGASCEQVDSKTAHKYQQLAVGYLKGVDDVANLAEDVDAWYYEKIAPFQSGGVSWQIRAGERISDLKSTEAVKGLFTSLGSRDFAFHQWSHWTVCEDQIGDIEVTTRYHGVVREMDAVNQDIFGEAVMNFKTRGSREDLITEVVVVRSQTIDRPY